MLLLKILVWIISLQSNPEVTSQSSLKAMENSIRMEPKAKLKRRSQVPEMHAFTWTQWKFSIVGISPSIVSRPFNWKILCGFLVLSVSIFCQLVYIFKDANTFAEYTQSIYIGSLILVIFAAMIILIVKRVTLYEFINCVDKILNTSKLNLIFNKKNICDNRLGWWIIFLSKSIFRIEIFRFDINLLQNQPSRTETEQNHVFHRIENYAVRRVCAMDHLYLFRLF